MKREATISADGLYRYDLTRTVQLGCDCVRCFAHFAKWRTTAVLPGYVLWVLCNPSTADAKTDDATERRGWGFTNRWGYGQMVFVNTNPFRSTDPSALRKITVPPFERNENDMRMSRLAREAALVICAWGKAALPYDVGLARFTLKEARRPVHVLELCNDGTPKHPLYLKEDTRPKLWQP